MNKLNCYFFDSWFIK